MRDPSTPALAATAATAILSSLLSAIVVLELSDCQETPRSADVETAPVIDLPGTSELSEQLEDLTSMVRDLSLGSSMLREPAPRAAAERDTAQSGRPVSRGEVLSALARVAASANGRVFRHVAANWHTLGSLRTLALANRRAAERQVGLMSVPELVARFGFPTRMSTNNHELVLHYERRNADNKREVVTFRLHSGYVASFGVDQQIATKGLLTSLTAPGQFAIDALSGSIRLQSQPGVVIPTADRRGATLIHLFRDAAVQVRGRK